MGNAAKAVVDVCMVGQSVVLYGSIVRHTDHRLYTKQL